MMQSIPEIGNRTLLEWRHADLNKDSNQLTFISDFFCGRHTFISYRAEDKTILQLKVFSDFVESDLPMIDRHWDKSTWIPEVLDNIKGSSNNIGSLGIATILKSQIADSRKSALIISTEGSTYQITAYHNKKLVYYNVILTERLEEILYYVSAVSETFLNESPHIFIESGLENYKTLKDVFSKYFHHISAINEPISEVCDGLNVEKLIDSNYAALKYLIAQQTSASQ